MREYMKSHIDLVDNYLNSEKHKDIESFLENHLRKIQIFQHERLIHLLVTLFYAIITLFFISLTIVNIIFVPIVIIVTTFLILYIYHYFYLENGVQYMYRQYDKLKELAKN